MNAPPTYCRCPEGSPCRGYPGREMLCRECLPREYPWRHTPYYNMAIRPERAARRAWKWATTPQFGYLDALFIGAVASLIQRYSPL